MISNGKKTVIVLGIARSKTSVVAGLLHYMGVDMNPVDNKCDGYPYGSFEDIEIQTLTRILSANLKNKKIIGKKTVNRIKQLLKVRSQKNDIWGWKSALTYRCIDCFIKYVISPHFVVVTRPIPENALSVQEHYKTNYNKNISLPEATNIVTGERRMLSSVLKKYSHVPQFSIKDEMLGGDLKELALSLSKFLGIELDSKKLERISTLYVRKDKRYKKGLNRFPGPVRDMTKNG